MEMEDVASKFPTDVIERARRILADIGSTGAYSESQGALVCREMIAKGIEERDGFPADPEDIFMTDGASLAVHGMLKMLIRGSGDAWLVPIPQYPLYSAGLTLAGGQLVPYYLHEDEGWSLVLEEMQEALDQVRAGRGCLELYVKLSVAVCMCCCLCAVPLPHSLCRQPFLPLDVPARTPQSQLCLGHPQFFRRQCIHSRNSQSELHPNPKP
jgi:DNA-binding transcriptional MocR family regulator